MDSLLNVLNEKIKKCTDELLFETIDKDLFDEKYHQLIDSFNLLITQLDENFKFSKNISSGNLDTEMPLKRNIMASNLKELYSKLININWQANQIAKGDFEQKLDFFGEFTKSFNNMVKKIKEREEASDKELERLNHSYDLLNLLFENLPEMAFVVRDNKVIYQNTSARTFLNIGIENTEMFKSIIKTCDERQEFHFKNDNLWFLIECSPVVWRDDANAVLFIVRDITAIKLREHVLEQEALKDPLTGIGNRNMARKKLESFISSSVNNPLSICFIDLDKLKKVNDTFGHLAGDEYIKNYAATLKNQLHNNYSVFRMSGDEFLILMPNTSHDTAFKVIRNFENVLHNRNDLSEIRTYDFSYGIYTYEYDSKTITTEELIDKADALMYQNKITKQRGEE